MNILKSNTVAGELAKTTAKKYKSGTDSVVIVINRRILVPKGRIRDFQKCGHKTIKKFKSFRLMEVEMAFKAESFHEIAKYLYTKNT